MSTTEFDKSRLGGQRLVENIAGHAYEGPGGRYTGVIELYAKGEIDAVRHSFKDVHAELADALSVDLSPIAHQFGLLNLSYTLIDHPHSIASTWLGLPNQEVSGNPLEDARAVIVMERRSQAVGRNDEMARYTPNTLRISGIDDGIWLIPGTGRPFAVAYKKVLPGTDLGLEAAMEVTAIDVGMTEDETNGGFATRIPTPIELSRDAMEAAGLFTQAMSKGNTTEDNLYPWAHRARGIAHWTGTGGGAEVRISHKTPFGMRDRHLDWETVEVDFQPIQEAAERGLTPWHLETPRYLPKAR